MKKFSILFFLGISIYSYSQDYAFYNINFEETIQLFRLEIDTVSNPNNIWHIGKPQKAVFMAAFSPQNAIVTDTLLPYPANDTSTFSIKHVSEWISGFLLNGVVILSGKYWVNSDTLNDFGIIEFSPDDGITWVNLLTDTLYLNQGCYFWNERPILSGNSTCWQDFFVDVSGFGPVFNIQPGDTVLYRFSFISDDIQTNKDGLMFDNLILEDYAEGINNLHNQFSSNIYPNPTSGLITIEFENPKNENHLLTIYNNNCQIILNMKIGKQDRIQLIAEDFKSGIYYYRLTNLQNRNGSIGKIIKK